MNSAYILDSMGTDFSSKLKKKGVWHSFVDGYCSTVQGLLDWFEVDLGLGGKVELTMTTHM